MEKITESYQPSKEYRQLRQNLSVPFNERRQIKILEQKKLKEEFGSYLKLIDFLVDNPSCSSKDFQNINQSKILYGE